MRTFGKNCSLFNFGTPIGTRLRQWALTVFLTLTLASCATLNEEVRLNKDGSGSYSLNFDMSKLLEMQGALQGLGADSLKGDQTRHDSTMYFSAMRDSMPNLEDPNHVLDKARVHMVMDMPAKQLTIQMILDFDSVGDINAMYRLLDQAKQSPANPNAKFNYSEMASGSHPEFRLQGNKLTRTQTKPETDSVDEQSQGLLDLLTASTAFKCTYIFPKKAKHSTIPGSKIMDRNTVVVEKQYSDVTSHPEEMEGEIVFK